jgi:hypothetical protein
MNPVVLSQLVICPHCGMSLSVVAIKHRLTNKIEEWRAKHETTGFCQNDNMMFVLPTIECKSIEE